jgi:hypothetical protein
MSGGSTLPRRALGRRLRDLRLKAEKSLLAAAVQIDVSKQTIGRMEEGQYVRISAVQYHSLLDLYAADQAAREEVTGLIEEVKSAKGDSVKGWWRAYDDVVNRDFDHFMSLEQACNRMTTFQLALLPGLLQTREYRRWVMETIDPMKSETNAERQLELMVRRQKRISMDPDFSLEVLLFEAALRQCVGGPEAMAEQLEHLVDVGQLPNVSIRIIPFGVPPFAGLISESFTFFGFRPSHVGRMPEPPVVFVEGLTGALFFESEGTIELYKSALSGIRDVALSEEDTRALALEIAEEYRL